MAVKLFSMALPPMICAPLDGRSSVGSMCYSKICRNLDLSVLLDIQSEIDSGHGTGPRGSDNVHPRSTLCSIEILRFVNRSISS